MSEWFISSICFKKRTTYYLVLSLAINIPLTVYASDNMNRENILKADFDTNFLVGNAQKIDIGRFKYGNPILPGEYSLDVYINGQWLGKREFVFKSTRSNENAKTCFTPDMLLEYGVKPEILHHEVSSTFTCNDLDKWVNDAFYQFDTSRLRLDISIPQVALQKNAQGYVDPRLWDRGINAAFFAYNASAYRIVNNNHETNHAFMGTNVGLNLYDWQLRHTGQWKWQDHNEIQEKVSSYTSNNTYAQKAFPKLNSVVTLGDYFTNNNFFDALPYRGINISSDDRMLPNSMLGYAPQIRGYAKTNAKVEVRQQGNLIYQTTVTPGSFEINDLYPTGFGGELQVSIYETNGEIQKFSIPYASVVEMLRPKMSRYSFTLGHFRDANINLKPWLVQGKYQRGINNYLTSYTGFQATENYQSFLIGSAFATPIGAISFDATQSSAEFEQKPTLKGRSYRLSYNRLFTPTNTNLTLATYRYSTENYLKLRDSILIRDLQQQDIDSFSVGKQKSEFQITTLGMSGYIGDRFDYGSSISYQDQGQTSLNINGTYRTNYTTIGASFGQSDTYQQEMINLNGSLVAHSQGILFGPDQVQTMVLVYAPQATGARVGNTSGLSINKQGYAVIPYVTPYRLNDISLDPQGMPSTVELTETSHRIAPYAGSITKVNFSTKTGYAVFISTQTPNGGHLPFAAQVFNQNNEIVGMVAQGSRIYLRTPLTQDHLYVKWGQSNSEECQLDYDIQSKILQEKQLIIMTEAVCK
ncbi:fimbria/pilus outer membrane usher protein [Acinetobacter baumannii]|uniref:fimbria/pilus outer membrane usher protein n=1 Tax=Acinetobacter baumannii TaxID=470 RepID=UPI0029414533|nr:fimbria/pilus outer membrane usher protein [Acinetobacter baumannii]MDV4251625.1 fimbrial biogenesis outer membrane usher protein [Acinetobacter baumannii]